MQAGQRPDLSENKCLVFQLAVPVYMIWPRPTAGALRVEEERVLVEPRGYPGALGNPIQPGFTSPPVSSAFL